MSLMQETSMMGGRWLVRLQTRTMQLAQPRLSGMPNLFVLLWFPCLVAIVTVVLIVLGISGSSTTAWQQYFGAQPGATTIAGKPRPIRSDEWMIQSGWAVSQLQLNFPVVNTAFPGGVNALMYNDAPTWHWSTVFRPHVMGFLMLPLDQGMAMRWWAPIFALVASCYMFLILLLPSRPISAAALSIGAFFSPIIQWWMLPSTLWPVAWAFTVLAAVIIAVKVQRRWVRVLAAAVAGYLTVTMAMSLYVPYMIATFVPVLFLSVGLIVYAVRVRKAHWREVFARLAPLLIAGVTSILVVAVWLFEQRDSVKQVLSTAYPGARNTPPGQGDWHDLLALMSAPFQSALLAGDSSGLGANMPESASALLVSLFLLPAAMWTLRHHHKATGSFHWALMSAVAASLVVLAFLYIPGWAALSKPLGLFLTTEHRLRLAFVVLNVAMIALLVRFLDQMKQRAPWWVAASSMALVALSVGAVVLGLNRLGSGVLDTSRAWVWISLVLVPAVGWITRRRLFPAAVALLVISVVLCGRVNPVTSGVYDLRQTQAGQAVLALAATNSDAHWVNVGGPEVMSVLFEAGITTYGGMQTYPPAEMWNDIDPTAQYEYQWNRLAQVKWSFGIGEPVVTNPAPDAIDVTFDACSQFAQSNVRFVLSDVAVPQACTRTLQTVTQGATTLYIAEVQPMSRDAENSQ